MKISLNLSGPPSVAVDGARVEFATKKAEAIFYYTALKGQVSKQSLELMFWPELDEAHANKNLRNSIYYITRIFGAGVFKKSRGVLEFSGSVEFVENIDPLRGRFMEGFYLKDCPDFNSFVDEYNNSRDMQLYNSAKANFLRALSVGELDDMETLNRYGALSRMDPYDEEVVFALMEHCFGEGRLDEVVKLYRDFERKMLRDLMLEPLKDIQNLYRAALLRKKAERGAAAPFFFGRLTELKRLSRSHRDFLSGSQYTDLIISGGIGSGKTYLLSHYMRNSGIKGTKVLELVCYEAERKIEYRVLSLLIGKMLKALKVDTKDLPESYRQILVYFFPFMFGKGAHDGQSDVKDGNLPFFELEELLSELFARLTARAKFVIVIDDIRYCDRMSFDFIQRVALCKYHGRALFFISCHDSWLKEYLKTFDKNTLRNIDILELKNFRRDEVEAIASRRLKAPAPETVDALYKESGGNPLYLFEIINSLKDNKPVNNYKFIYLLENRLKTLSSYEQMALYISSAFFSDIMPEAVADIIGVDSIRILELYESLVQNGFLKEEIRDGHLTLMFAHEQFRLYIYQSQPLIKRKTIHMKIAEYLASCAREAECERDYIDSIIYHYHSAGQMVKYLSCKLRKALNIVSVDHDFPEFLSGVTQDFIAKLEEEFCLVSVPLDLKYEFTLLKASFAVKTCNYDEGLKLIRFILESDTDKRRLLKARKQLIYYGIQTRDHAMIRENAIAALRILKERPDDVEKADILKSYALAELNCRHCKNAGRILLRSLAMLDGMPLSETVLYIRACIFNYLAYEHKYAGEYERCIPFYMKSIEICTSANITNGLPLFYMNLGQALMKMGRQEEAKKYFLKFEVLRERIYSALSTTIVKAYLALIYCIERNYRLSAKYLAEGFECSLVIKNSYEYAYLYKICALLKKTALKDCEAAGILNAVLPESYGYYYERASENFKKIGLERELAELDRM